MQLLFWLYLNIAHDLTCHPVCLYVFRDRTGVHGSMMRMTERFTYVPTELLFNNKRKSHYSCKISFVLSSSTILIIKSLYVSVLYTSRHFHEKTSCFIGNFRVAKCTSMYWKSSPILSRRSDFSGFREFSRLSIEFLLTSGFLGILCTTL